MQQPLTNAILMRFLKNKRINSGFMDGLKLHYRPLICPYVSLIGKVGPRDKVGDVGCGSGQFLLLLSEFAGPSLLYGLEVTEKLVANSRHLLAGQEDFRATEVEKYDGIHFPGRLAELDIVFLIDVLHHIPVPRQEPFLANLAGTMKSGARLVIKDIDAGNPLVIFNKLHDLVVSREIGHELRIKSVIGILQKNGMDIKEIEKCTTYVYPHYTIVATKP
jgi:SAM-dependent methyltransferase